MNENYRGEEARIVERCSRIQFPEHSVLDTVKKEVRFEYTECNEAVKFEDSPCDSLGFNIWDALRDRELKEEYTGKQCQKAFLESDGSWNS